MAVVELFWYVRECEWLSEILQFRDPNFHLLSMQHLELYHRFETYWAVRLRCDKLGESEIAKQRQVQPRVGKNSESRIYLRLSLVLE